MFVRPEMLQAIQGMYRQPNLMKGNLFMDEVDGLFSKVQATKRAFGRPEQCPISNDQIEVKTI